MLIASSPFLPQPRFDFSSGTLDGATLSRSSSGTRFDDSGMLIAMPADAARFDHDPVTRALRGLLVEPRATNEVWYSQDISRNTIDPPDTAHFQFVRSNLIAINERTLVEFDDGSGNIPSLQTLHATAAGTVMTMSVVATAYRPAGSGKRFLQFREQRFSVYKFPPAPICAWDIEAGTVAYSNEHTAASAAIEQIGDVSWRCSVSLNITADQPFPNAHYNLYIVRDAAATPAWSTDGISGVQVTHLQLEQGARAPVTSIMPTSGAPVTRDADLLVLPWARRGVPDGPITARFVFDDGSSQDRTMIVAGGVAAVPTDLARTRLRAVSAIS